MDTKQDEMKQEAEEVGVLAQQMVYKVLAAGLPWDQAVMALGVAAKAISMAAAQAGDGGTARYVAHAQQRLEQGFGQSVRVAGEEERTPAGATLQ